MQKNKLYIHVGMPRTGTTFLQHKIFPYLKGYEYFHNSECLLLLNHFKKVVDEVVKRRIGI